MGNSPKLRAVRGASENCQAASINPMPELPEVETVVRDLRPQLLKRKIRAVEVSKFSLRRKWNAEWNDLLAGRRIQEVRRRGKWIIVALDQELYLLFHLGMTGQMTVTASKQPKRTHTHMILTLDRGGKQLRFRDTRRFGSASLFHSAEELEQFFETSKLGPEPFDLPMDYLRAKITSAKRNLKAILLDQRIIAGVGNIYADEALFAVRLPPTQLGSATTAAQIRRLRDALVVVLNRAIEYRGSTIRDYIGGSGAKGQFQEEFAVYGRTGKPCLRCGTKIERMRLAGRSTHYCPKCQKMKKKPARQ